MEAINVALRPPAEDFPNRLRGPRAVTLAPRYGLLAVLALLCFIPRATLAWSWDLLWTDTVDFLHAADWLRAGYLPQAFEQFGLNLYPVLLAGLRNCCEDWLTPAKWLNVAFATLTVLPLFGWVRRQFDDQVAVLACVLYAAHGKLVAVSFLALRDPPFWLFFVLTIYLLWRAVVEVRLRWFALGGVSLMCAGLLRPEGWLLVLPLVGWAAFRWPHVVGGRKRLALGVVLALAVTPATLIVLNLTLLRSCPQWGVLSRQHADTLRRWLSPRADPAVDASAAHGRVGRAQRAPPIALSISNLKSQIESTAADGNPLPRRHEGLEGQCAITDICVHPCSSVAIASQINNVARPTTGRPDSGQPRLESRDIALLNINKLSWVAAEGRAGSSPLAESVDGAPSPAAIHSAAAKAPASDPLALPSAGVSRVTLLKNLGLELVRAYTYALGLLALLGVVGWYWVYLRRDHQTLLAMAVLLLVGIWVRSQQYRYDLRYFLPMVLVSFPWMALGILAVPRYAARWGNLVLWRRSIFGLGATGSVGALPGSVDQTSTGIASGTQSTGIASGTRAWLVGGLTAVSAALSLAEYRYSPTIFMRQHAAIGRAIADEVGPGRTLATNIREMRLVEHYSRGMWVGYLDPAECVGDRLPAWAEKQPPDVLVFWHDDDSDDAWREYAEAFCSRDDLRYRRVDLRGLPSDADVIVLARRE